MNSSRRDGSVGGTLLVLLVGGLIGAGVCYFFLELKSDVSPPAVEREAPTAATPGDDNYFERKMREWNLSPDEIKRDLGAAGQVVREKGRALGQKVAGATSDVTIIAKIKAKFTLDDQLEALKITVGCKEGHVTLSGSVATQELIGRAIVLVLDTDGVVDVVSSLKVERSATPI